MSRSDTQWRESLHLSKAFTVHDIQSWPILFLLGVRNTLWWTTITIWKITIFQGKSAIFMGHIFNSKPLVVPGRVHEASHVGWSVTDCRQWVPSNHQMPGVYRVSPRVVVLQDWNSSEIRDIVRYQETIPLEMMIFHGMFHKIPLEMLMFHGISQGFFLDFAISASMESMESMEFPGWLLGTSLQSHACRRSVLWRMNWIKVRGWNTLDFEIFLQKIGEIFHLIWPRNWTKHDEKHDSTSRKWRLSQPNTQRVSPEWASMG